MTTYLQLEAGVGMRSRRLNGRPLSDSYGGAYRAATWMSKVAGPATSLSILHGFNQTTATLPLRQVYMVIR